MSITETAAFEQALSAPALVPATAGVGPTMRGLLRDLPVEAAPQHDLLRRRIERTITPDRGDRRGLLGWSAIAASLLLALGLGWLGGSLVGQGNREVDELLAGYVRVAMSEHAVDVASSDRHTVKPWFAGRVDYAPPVHDLTAAGFSTDRRPHRCRRWPRQAVLVYRRNQHRIVHRLAGRRRQRGRQPSANATALPSRVGARRRLRPACVADIAPERHGEVRRRCERCNRWGAVTSHFPPQRHRWGLWPRYHRRLAATEGHESWERVELGLMTLRPRLRGHLPNAVGVEFTPAG